MLTDLFSISIWYLTIFILGLLSFPILFLIFKKFIDRAYIFSKILTPILISFIFLLFGVLGALPFSLPFIYLFLFLFLILDIFLLYRKKNYLAFISFIKKRHKLLIFEELVFLLILVLWSFLRAFNPAIEGLEKYMDWGFLNSILRSNSLPPQDIWFAGSTINYYYFGHLIFAFLTKLSNLNSTITYNLAIATVAALTFVSTFSLSLNLIFTSLKKTRIKKIILISLFPAFLLTFGGNLHPVYKFVQSKITNTEFKYWYPDATRFIGYDPLTTDKTIHEFPLYSFVVSDLHGHMNDIPIVIFFMAFLLNSFLIYSPKFFNWKFIIPSAFLLAIIYMTNAWDFAVYGLLLAIFTLLVNIKNNPNRLSFYKTISTGLLIIIFWYLFSLPFSLNFQPMMEGVRLTTSHSYFYQLLILYGGFFLISFPFYFFFLTKKPKKIADLFIVSTIIIATLLILIPELFYLKDIYTYEHRRANTMFKLTYQAFILYSLGSGYVLFRLSTLKSKILLPIYKVLFALVFVLHLIYPFFAIKSFYNFRKYQSLNGLTYLQKLYPDNFEAINWLQENIKGQPVLLEAVGDSYTTFNHLSSATGLPTVQGWVVHEWLWRGGYTFPKQRQDHVADIYQSPDLNKSKELLEKYQVEYILVGPKEFEKYPKLNQQKFIDLGGQVVFNSGQTTIYQL
jgi:uncharacterized membrane protein